TDRQRASVEDRNSGQLSHAPVRQIRSVEARGESLSARNRGDRGRGGPGLNQSFDDPGDCFTTFFPNPRQTCGFAQARKNQNEYRSSKRSQSTAPVGRF